MGRKSTSLNKYGSSEFPEISLNIQYLHLSMCSSRSYVYIFYIFTYVYTFYLRCRKGTGLGKSLQKTVIHKITLSCSVAPGQVFYFGLLLPGKLWRAVQCRGAGSSQDLGPRRGPHSCCMVVLPIWDQICIFQC